jgi:glycosyltransferase involved in cell wall biosynthesis
VILFAHLLNDRSGSPRVLASVISCLRESGHESRLLVGSEGSGWLDEAGIAVDRYWYRRSPHRLVTLFTYVVSQLALFLKLLRARGVPKNAIVYVNTLLPFGAALFGWVTNRAVIYHLHEVSVTPAPLRWWLTAVARMTARRLIYVSQSHRASLPIAHVPATIVYNALDEAFAHRAELSEYVHRRAGCFRVLMLASLRAYKGIPEYVALARQFEARGDILFELVANDDADAVSRYFAGHKELPHNLRVHARATDPSPFYARASLVLNLSRPDSWVETFGLTLLEAMAFGIPVIAPPVGGPTELVRDGVDGFFIDSRDAAALEGKVRLLADDDALCMRMSASARRNAWRFSHCSFCRGVHDAIQSVCSR